MLLVRAKGVPNIFAEKCSKARMPKMPKIKQNNILSLTLNVFTLY
jgi:hypothetical protein